MRKQQTTVPSIVPRVHCYEDGFRDRLGRGSDVVAGSRELVRRANEHRPAASVRRAA